LTALAATREEGSPYYVSPENSRALRSTAEQIAKLDRALKLFSDAKARREEAERGVQAAKFELGDLSRAPRVTGDIKAMAQHEAAIENAQIALNKATKVFIDINREVEQAAVAVSELHATITHAARLELEPVRRAAMKQFEAALDGLLAAIEVCTALNRVLGNGQSYIWPQIPHPLNGDDAAYRRPRAEPAVAPEWLRYQKLRGGAMDAASEVPPAQAAE
jgi:hypothetical protein